MTLKNWGVAAIAAALGILVLALGSAGVAGGAVVGPEQNCNQTGRLFCITLSTFEAITASDADASKSNGKRYTWVEWAMTNNGGSTLTNPKITVSLADYNCAAYVPPVEGQKPDPRAGHCGAALTRSSEFQTPGSPPNVSCTLASATQTLTCSYQNLSATGANKSTPTTRFYFKTARVPATHTVISVTGTVKERASDANGCAAGDPNCDTFTTSIVNSYEPEPNAAYTFVLDNNSFRLETNDTFSSFEFTSLKPNPFRANFVTSYPVATCGSTPSPTCFFRTLTVTTADPVTTDYNDGPVVFYARLTGLPPGVNANNVVATHTYDDTTSTVIGDVNGERTSKGCTFTYSNSTDIPLPSICAKKVPGQQAVDVWVWDSDNGGIKFG
jgi:hypothetical protein